MRSKALPGCDEERTERIVKNKRLIKSRNFKVLLMGTALACSIFVAACGKEEAPVESTEGGKIQRSTEASTETNAETELGIGAFEAKTLDGGSFTDKDIAEKDATLLNFWATYCGPCIEELPDIAKLEKELPDNVQIVTVCLDAGTEADTAEEILKEAGFEGITLVSGNGGLAEIIGSIMYTPTTIVVDSEGKLVGDAIIGGQKNLEEAFTAALNGALKSTGKTEIKHGEE